MTDIMKVKKSLKRTKPTQKRQSSVSALKKRLDAIFSLYIRNRDGGRCFTCGIKRDIKQMQNGHYISRSHNNTRYDEENCHCQCVGCNIFKHGSMDEYAQNLEATYGTGILQRLIQKKRVIKQWTPQELQTLIDRYRNMNPYEDK